MADTNDVVVSEGVRAMSDARPEEVRKSLDQLLVNLRRSGVSADEESKAIEHLKALAGKCGDLEEWKPYGGATSFAEVEAWIASMETTADVNEVSYEFQSIVDNVWRTEDIDVLEKASRIARAAGELQSRLNSAGRKDAKPSLIDRVKGVFMPAEKATALPSWLDVDPDEAGAEKAQGPAATSAFFKDADGNWRYVSVASNCYRDKQKEVFDANAHEDYVAYVDHTKDFPDLVLWHDLRTKVGKADCIYYDRETGYRVSTGTFDKGMEDVAERLSQMPELAMSHGFIYRKSELLDGHYRRYRSFEETVLPEAKYAANEGTAFFAVREAPMIPDVKRKFFEAALGPERLARLEASLGERSATMSDDELNAAVKAAVAAEPTGDVVVAGAEAAPVAVAAVPAAAAVPTAVEGADKAIDLVEAVKSALPAIVAAGLKEAMDPLAERLTAIEAKQATIETALAETKQTDDARIASMFGVRAMNPGAVTAPSEDAANTVTKAQAEKIIAAAGGKDDGDGTTPAANPHVSGVMSLLSDAFKGPGVATT